MQIRSVVLSAAVAAALGACASPRHVAQEPSPVPDAAAQASLHDRVHGALVAGMGAAAGGITVRIDGTTVFLTGHVASQADKERAHDIAHGVSGAGRVVHGGLMVH